MNNDHFLIQAQEPSPANLRHAECNSKCSNDLLPRYTEFLMPSKQDQMNTQGLFLVNLRFFWEKACCPQNVVVREKHVLKVDTDKQKQRKSLSIYLVTGW